MFNINGLYAICMVLVYCSCAENNNYKVNDSVANSDYTSINPLSAGDAFKRIHTVFPQLKFDRNSTNMHV